MKSIPRGPATLPKGLLDSITLVCSKFHDNTFVKNIPPRILQIYMNEIILFACDPEQPFSIASRIVALQPFLIIMQYYLGLSISKVDSDTPQFTKVKDILDEFKGSQKLPFVLAMLVDLILQSDAKATELKIAETLTILSIEIVSIMDRFLQYDDILLQSCFPGIFSCFLKGLFEKRLGTGISSTTAVQVSFLKGLQNWTCTVLNEVRAKEKNRLHSDWYLDGIDKLEPCQILLIDLNMDPAYKIQLMRYFESIFIEVPSLLSASFFTVYIRFLMSAIFSPDLALSREARRIVSIQYSALKAPGIQITKKLSISGCIDFLKVVFTNLCHILYTSNTFTQEFVEIFMNFLFKRLVYSDDVTCNNAIENVSGGKIKVKLNTAENLDREDSFSSIDFPSLKVALQYFFGRAFKEYPAYSIDKIVTPLTPLSLYFLNIFFESDVSTFPTEIMGRIQDRLISSIQNPSTCSIIIVGANKGKFSKESLNLEMSLLSMRKKFLNCIVKLGATLTTKEKLQKYLINVTPNLLYLTSLRSLHLTLENSKIYASVSSIGQNISSPLGEKQLDDIFFELAKMAGYSTVGAMFLDLRTHIMHSFAVALYRDTEGYTRGDTRSVAPVITSYFLPAALSYFICHIQMAAQSMVRLLDPFIQNANALEIENIFIDAPSGTMTNRNPIGILGVKFVEKLTLLIDGCQYDDLALLQSIQLFNLIFQTEEKTMEEETIQENVHEESPWSRFLGEHYKDIEAMNSEANLNANLQSSTDTVGLIGKIIKKLLYLLPHDHYMMKNGIYRLLLTLLNSIGNPLEHQTTTLLENSVGDPLVASVWHAVIASLPPTCAVTLLDFDTIFKLLLFLLQKGTFEFMSSKICTLTEFLQFYTIQSSPADNPKSYWSFLLFLFKFKGLSPKLIHHLWDYSLSIAIATLTEQQPRVQWPANKQEQCTYMTGVLLGLMTQFKKCYPEYCFYLMMATESKCIQISGLEGHVIDGGREKCVLSVLRFEPSLITKRRKYSGKEKGNLHRFCSLFYPDHFLPGAEETL